MLEVFILLNLILIHNFAVCNTILIPNNFEIEMAALAYVNCYKIIFRQPLLLCYM